MFRLLAVVGAAAALAASLVGAAAASSAGTAARSAVAAPSAAGSFPRYDHVFMLMEENHGFNQLIGNPAAPTINALAQQYGYSTQYYGVTPTAP
jgi:phospholipase C